MLHNQSFMRVISAVTVLVMLPFYLLTYGIDLISVSGRCEEESSNIVGIGAYFRSQGVTADDEGNLYFSSKTTLVKTQADARGFVAANYSAIPDELADNYGIKHIGGLSYYNGYIYAGLEDSKVWDHPIVCVYDAKTLEAVEWFELDDEMHTRGLPWVCVNPENGLLYAFDHSKNPTAVLVYDTADSMKNVGRVELEESIYSIQGAEFCNGILYAATNDDTQAVYAVDVNTGKSEKLFDRNLTSGSEGEGMTFVEKDGETYLLAMDMGPLFINANVRWYEFEGQGLE
ncbi:MAG: PQQ-like beta-propeller repeat protein [Clostridia bacterium]|nr:PQQ-like beta-propeller repeat protein [Clostridia bacterium]